LDYRFQSGLLGISETSSDMQDLLEREFVRQPAAGDMKGVIMDLQLAQATVNAAEFYLD
jgi:acetate kinase